MRNGQPTRRCSPEVCARSSSTDCNALRPRIFLFLVLAPTFFLLGTVEVYAQGASLSVSLPPSETGVGHILSEKSHRLYWFAATNGRPTVLTNLEPDAYFVDLLCPPSALKEPSLTIQVSSASPSHARFTESPQTDPDVRVESSSSYTLVFRLPPSPPIAGVENWRCDLQKTLLPFLLGRRGRFADATEVSQAIAKLAGGTSGLNLPVKTPVEIYLSEINWIEGKATTDPFRPRTERILTDAAKLWSRGKAQVLGQESLDDEQSHLYLGMLTAAATSKVLEEDRPGSIEVCYLSSHEDLSSFAKGAVYELEVTAEAPSSGDSRLFVGDERFNPQQIAPQVNQGAWSFPVKALSGFKESTVRLNYQLLKEVGGSRTVLR